MRLSLQILSQYLRLVFICSFSAEEVVQVGDTVEDYSRTCGCVFLVFRNALVVGVPVCVPDLSVVKVISLRILDVEAECRYSIHCEVRVV